MMNMGIDITAKNVSFKWEGIETNDDFTNF